MAKLVYSRADQRLYFIEDDGQHFTSIECRNDFYPTSNCGTEQHETLPLGEYVCNAEEPPAENSAAYGTFYVSTGDPRGRDIHGGGSDLPDPFAPRQGWEKTYGCLRAANEDGEAISRMILDAGNAVPLTVQEEAYNA